MGLFGHSNPVEKESNDIRKKFINECKLNWKKLYSDCFTYLGGCTGFPDTFKGFIIPVKVYSGAIVLEGGPTVSTEYKYYSYTLPIQNIIDTRIEDETQIQKEVTAGRLLALGLLAFAAKKKTETGNEYIIISYKNLNGDIKQMVFSIEAKASFCITSFSSAIMKAKKKYLNNKDDKQYIFKPQYGYENIDLTAQDKSDKKSTQSDIPTQIKELADLKNQGILTEVEFNQKKTELLAKM